MIELKVDRIQYQVSLNLTNITISLELDHPSVHDDESEDKTDYSNLVSDIKTDKNNKEDVADSSDTVCQNPEDTMEGASKVSDFKKIRKLSEEMKISITGESGEINIDDKKANKDNSNEDKTQLIDDVKLQIEIKDDFQKNIQENQQLDSPDHSKTEEPLDTNENSDNKIVEVSSQDELIEKPDILQSDKKIEEEKQKDIIDNLEEVQSDEEDELPLAKELHNLPGEKEA